MGRKDRKHMVGNVYFKMYGYGLLSLSLEWSQVLILHKKTFSTDILTALKSSLKHHCKHVLRALQLYGDQA